MLPWFTTIQRLQRVLEDTPYKKVFEVPKEKSGECLGALLELAPVDVTIEEEEIGKVVERIYREGNPSACQGSNF